MGEMFDDDQMYVPNARKIKESSKDSTPYFLLGDEIFPLKKWLMRPYPGKNATEEERIYNYRHSRARRCIENAFGILSARWRIFQKPIRATVDHVECYTLACLALHNYLRLTSNATYSPSDFIDSEDKSGNLLPEDWRNSQLKDGNNGAIVNLPRVRGSRTRQDVLIMRDHLKDYLNSEEGSVSWQVNYVRRTSHYAV